MTKRPRCGEPMSGGKKCGRPRGHTGIHMGEASVRRSQDRRTEKRRELGAAAVFTHGYGGYSRGCRCDTCKAAKADYMRDRRAPNPVLEGPGRLIVLDPAVTHGTRFAYEERGCRCGECVTAQRAGSRHPYTPVRAAS